MAGVAARLRAPDGCPWDREQTHESLRPLLIEEAYEAMDAIETGDPAAMREELGDLLFQVVIHAQLAAERGDFDLATVVKQVADKLVRRHPHVFAGRELEGDALIQWERIKRKEREDKAASGERAESMLASLPSALPALYGAQRMQDRVARVGLERDRLDFPLDVDDPEQLGELLFDFVALARERGWDAEDALRKANARFAERVKRIEALGKPLEEYAPDELRKLWEEHA